MVEITLQGSPRLEIAGAGRGLSFAYRTDYIGASYRAQPRVTVQNSEIVFVGYGINAPERGWNDYEGARRARQDRGHPGQRSRLADEGLEGPFNGRAMTYYGRWTYKFEEAARQGAAAALIVHDTAPASYGWNVGREQLDRAAALYADAEQRRGPDRDERLADQRRRRGG